MTFVGILWLTPRAQSHLLARVHSTASAALGVVGAPSGDDRVTISGFGDLVKI